MRRPLGLIPLGLAAWPVLAQVPPGDDPELTGSAPIARGEQLRTSDATDTESVSPVEAPRISPVRPHQPERVGGTGRLLPEGSFIVDQPGDLRASPSRAWVFAPEPGDEASASGQIRPMIILPSQILGRLERLVGEADTTGVRLTGRVTLFRGQNYLLVTSIGTQTRSTPSGEQPGQPEAATENQNESELSTAVESLIDQLESERTGVQGVISSLGSGDEGAIAPVAEGRMISRRRGRFVRLDAGELAVRFDTDHADPPIDAPLVIAPSALLELVERTLEIHGDSMTATVSGQTLAFGGRAFLLPTSIVIDRPTELDSRQ